MSDPADGRVDEPTVTLESIHLGDETVVMLTQTDNERAWMQSDTVVTVDP
ncbi:hypothetical protein [Halorientalis marina]|jgi:hypothetical protein|nr:hypothetical protein [Halorientalis marina]